MSKTATSLREALAEPGQWGLVVQGGGMRGQYSTSALAELEAAGFSNRFSDIYGTSAGALNAAYFVAGQSEVGPGVYRDHLSGGRFINPRRVRKVLDIDFLIDEIFSSQVALDVSKVMNSEVRLHIGLCRARDGQLVWATNHESWPLMECLRATAAMPLAYGREVEIHGERYVDGGFVCTVPIAKALADGHTRLLVILTREPTYQPAPATGWMLRALQLAARVQRHSPGVLPLLNHFDTSWQVLSDAQKTHELWVVAPSAQIADRLCRDKQMLAATEAIGRADMRKALDGQVRL